MNQSDIIELIQSCFKSNDRVIVLKGSWGVGKTWIWHELLKQTKSNGISKFSSYTYSSLFGKKSLEDVKFDMVANLESRQKKIFSASRFFLKKKKTTETLGATAEVIPYAGKVAGKLIKDVPEFALARLFNQISNTLICLDDLERGTNDIDFIELLGLVNTLKERGNTLIIILNDKQLESTDNSILDKFRERVVDFEVEYIPDPVYQAQTFLSPKGKYYNILCEVIGNLKIRNIRVIRKIENIVHQLMDEHPKVQPSLIEDLVTRIALISMMYYDKDGILNLEFFKKFQANYYSLYEEVFPSRVYMPVKKENSDEKKFSLLEIKQAELLFNLNYTQKVIDDAIVEYLSFGSLKRETFDKQIFEMNNVEPPNIIVSKLREAWSLYGSFATNGKEFIDSMLSLLETHYLSISTGDYKQIADILTDLKVEVPSYIVQHFKIQNAMQIDDHYLPASLDSAKSKEEQEILKMEYDRRVKELTIDSVLRHIAKSSGWDNLLARFLNSFSIEEYYNWIVSGQGDGHINNIRTALGLSSSNVQRRDEEDVAIKVRDALQQVAAQNDFQALRMKNIFGILPPETIKDPTQTTRQD